MPIKASMIKMLLKMICAFQDNSSITPPQLQGIFLLKANIPTMYTMNMLIKIRELYNPFSRQRGTIKSITVKNSTHGSNEAITAEKGANKGEDAICSLNML